MNDPVTNALQEDLDYSGPVEIADGVFWVGFFDEEAGLHCNPYLIVDGDEAVVIDGGSRPDFPTVMMKVLQTGVSPDHIKALIYQHYDPDLCGSIPNFEDLIEGDNLQILSHWANIMFIRHYAVGSQLTPTQSIDNRFVFSSGRELQFINTPYAHSAGSFITFDKQTGILFTSDLFGSYAKDWELVLKLHDDCAGCLDHDSCKHGRHECPLQGIVKFHRTIMTSQKALRYAMQQMLQVPFRLVAPQHGSILASEPDILLIAELLAGLDGIGIDSVVNDEDEISSEEFSLRLAERLE